MCGVAWRQGRGADNATPHYLHCTARRLREARWLLLGDVRRLVGRSSSFSGGLIRGDQCRPGRSPRVDDGDETWYVCLFVCLSKGPAPGVMERWVSQTREGNPLSGRVGGLETNSKKKSSRKSMAGFTSSKKPMAGRSTTRLVAHVVD